MKRNLVRIIQALFLMLCSLAAGALMLAIGDRFETNLWSNIAYLALLIMVHVTAFGFLRFALFRAPIHFPESKTVKLFDSFIAWTAVFGFVCPMIEAIAVVFTILNLIAGVGVIVLACQDMQLRPRSYQ